MSRRFDRRGVARALAACALVGVVIVVVGVAGEREAEAAGPWWAVIEPGYPGTTKEAVGFMSQFSDYIASRANLAGLSGAYFNKPDDALAAIRERSPRFAIVSLGFYLEHRRALGLEPMLEAAEQERLFLVTVDGQVGSAEDLDGQTVGGGPFYEPGFIDRVAFPDAEVSSWKAEPLLSTTRALRRLVRGRYKGVVLTGRELESLKGQYRGKKLEKVLVSDYYPPALLVLCGKRAPAAKEVEDVESTAPSSTESPAESSAAPSGDSGGKKPAQASIQRSEGVPTEPAHGPVQNGPVRGVVAFRTAETAASEGAPQDNADPSSEESEERPSEPTESGSSGSGLTAEQRAGLERALLNLANDPDGRALLQEMGGKGFKKVRAAWLKRMEGSYDAHERK